MSAQAPAPSQSQSLQYADATALRQELELGDPSALAADAQHDPKLAQQAEDVVARILKVDINDSAAHEQTRGAVENMGAELQKEASRRSAMLKQPLKQLMERGEDGGQVANTLIDLKMQVEELDPARIDLEAGWFTRALGQIPGIGSPLKRYFSRYESASTTIDAIVRSLKAGQDQLKRDNVTLADDQKAMRDLTLKLERAIKLGLLIDQRLQKALDQEIASDDPRYKFIGEELLFPLRQRIQDLQQQLLVNQQGYLTTELVIRNNKELIRGVSRATNVTVSALQVAVTLALALANQRIVLDKIQAISATTDNLLAGTAERLKTQGVEIHKQASGTQLNIETLKKAFDDIRIALEDVSNYRQQALPQMAQSILEMDQLASKTEEQIKRFEHAGKVSGDFSIEIVD
jgi:uncharacterized protein YaaN involved in tellurite resistance